MADPGYRTGNFGIEITDEGKLEIRLRSLGRQKGDEIKDIAEGAARRAAFMMKQWAPKGKTLGLYRNIGWTQARFIPGGAGGGGTYVATAGVRKHNLHGVPMDYPTHVFRGTGIFAGKGPIRPTTGNVLVIEGLKTRDMDRGMAVKPRSGPIFTRYIKGQRPQTYWVEVAQDSASRFVRDRLVEVHRNFRRKI